MKAGVWGAAIGGAGGGRERGGGQGRGRGWSSTAYRHDDSGGMRSQGEGGGN